MKTTSKIILLCVALSAATAATQPWMDVTADPSARAQALLKRMNVTEKTAMLHGTKLGYTGGVVGNERLGIPVLQLNDGPQGFRLRPNEYPGTTTSWPSGMTVGATFDRELAQQWGEAMGAEFAGKGATVQLGPGLCLARVPVNGRNFEYLSGEDPWLGRAMVEPVVRGIQSQRVIANAKHWYVSCRTAQGAAVAARRLPSRLLFLTLLCFVRFVALQGL